MVIKVGCQENHWVPGFTVYNTLQATATEAKKPADAAALDPVAPLFTISSETLSPAALF